jgi:hypothetical protein
MGGKLYKIVLSLMLLSAVPDRAHAQWCAMYFIQADQIISSGRQLTDKQKMIVDACLKGAREAEAEVARLKREKETGSDASSRSNPK